MRALLICFLGVIMVGPFLASCEECDACGPLQREPAVNLKFINQDSLEAIQADIVVVNSNIERINADLQSINDELEFYNDSLQVVEQEIAGGATDLDDLQAQLTAKTDSLQTTFTEQQELRLAEEEKLSELQIIETTIENGSVRLDSLVSTTNNTSFDFGADSLSLFRFPLSVNMDSTVYEIYLGGSTYDLSLQYVRNFNEDEKSRIEVVASNVIITDHSFKEAINSCEVCSSNETSITVFF